MDSLQQCCARVLTRASIHVLYQGTGARCPSYYGAVPWSRWNVPPSIPWCAWFTILYHEFHLYAPLLYHHPHRGGLQCSTGVKNQENNVILWYRPIVLCSKSHEVFTVVQYRCITVQIPWGFYNGTASRGGAGCHQLSREFTIVFGCTDHPILWFYWVFTMETNVVPTNFIIPKILWGCYSGTVPGYRKVVLFSRVKSLLQRRHLGEGHRKNIANYHHI